MRGIFIRRAVRRHLIERLGTARDIAPVFLQDVQRHAVKIQIRVAHSQFGPLVEFARNAVYGFVCILFGQQASPAFEKLYELAAYALIFFRRALRVSAKLRQQFPECLLS